MQGQLYVISGPSGVGKSTVSRILREKTTRLGYSISHTSRRPRPNEKDGVDYHFVDEDVFKRMINQGLFVEWAQVYHDLYGTSFSSLNKQLEQGLDVLLDLDPQGARNVKDSYKACNLIFILPPSLDELEKRLRARAQDNDQVINTRIKSAFQVIREFTWYDFLIINDDLEKTVKQLKSIIISGRCKNTQMHDKVKKIFGL